MGLQQQRQRALRKSAIGAQSALQSEPRWGACTHQPGAGARRSRCRTRPCTMKRAFPLPALELLQKYCGCNRRLGGCISAQKTRQRSPDPCVISRHAVGLENVEPYRPACNPTSLSLRSSSRTHFITRAQPAPRQASPVAGLAHSQVPSAAGKAQDPQPSSWVQVVYGGG